mmetsp:Transcript_25020/g.68696  ORF Transcript_25020/g.68696 Transcript_25020/m.68696 type:complete len:256 (-) Transcript_25020:975-1742(-)
MSAVDMALDDVIKQNRNARSTRSGSGVVRGGRPPSRRAAAPYRRETGGSSGTMSGVSVTDLAASGNASLKVSSSSKPNTVAGAICNVVRESPGGNPPAVLATGPAALNQAIKAICIARKYLLEEAPPIDIVCKPTFEQDVREGSNVRFELKRSEVITREPSEDDLSAKDKTDCFKLAGAIAGRLRDGEEVAITTKGPVPVLVTVKAIALAQTYVQERDEAIDLSFAVQFRDLEDPELRGSPVSTFVHFAIVPTQL